MFRMGRELASVPASLCGPPLLSRSVPAGPGRALLHGQEERGDAVAVGLVDVGGVRRRVLAAHQQPQHVHVAGARRQVQRVPGARAQQIV